MNKDNPIATCGRVVRKLTSNSRVSGSIPPCGNFGKCFYHMPQVHQSHVREINAPSARVRVHTSGAGMCRRVHVYV